MYYVYILRCNDGSTYTGCTEDLKERFQRHTNGYIPATKPLLPVALIFYCAFMDNNYLLIAVFCNLWVTEATKEASNLLFRIPKPNK